MVALVVDGTEHHIGQIDHAEIRRHDVIMLGDGERWRVLRKEWRSGLRVERHSATPVTSCVAVVVVPENQKAREMVATGGGGALVSARSPHPLPGAPGNGADAAIERTMRDIEVRWPITMRLLDDGAQESRATEQTVPAEAVPCSRHRPKRHRTMPLRDDVKAFEEAFEAAATRSAPSADTRANAAAKKVARKGCRR